MSDTTKPKKMTAQDKALERAHKVLDMNPQIAILLGTHRDGMMLVEFAAEVAKVCQAVRKSAKKGHASLKIEFVPTKGDSSVVHTIDDISSKVPKPDVKIALMHIGDGNLPTYHDPSQLELNELDDEDTREVREIE